MRMVLTAVFLMVFAASAWAADTDTDGDGLSDFQETHKYFTDPAKADSDGDGTPDGGWDERRESAYTIRTVVRVMRSASGHLNDDYQDVRVLEQTPTWMKLEVVHYPLNTVASAIRPDPDWRQTARTMKRETVSALGRLTDLAWSDRASRRDLPAPSRGSRALADRRNAPGSLGAGGQASVPS